MVKTIACLHGIDILGSLGVSDPSNALLTGAALHTAAAEVCGVFETSGYLEQGERGLS